MTVKVEEEQLKTVLLSFIENAKNLKSFNLPLTFSDAGDVCELLDALRRSESFNTIEHVPFLTQDIFDEEEVFEKIIEIIKTAPSIKHLDLRDTDVEMDEDQTLKVLTALNESNAAANLHTLHLGHFD